MNTTSSATTTADQTSDRLSEEERAALKERAQELKGAKRRGKGDDAAAVLAKIAEMPEADRSLAERVHAVVTASAPELAPKLWYGMPAYARNGKIVCFFQGAAKFKARYATLGFNDEANLDDGGMWPTAFALAGWSDAVADQVDALVRRAVS